MTMTYNPLDNDDLRKTIFSYLRTPCDYRKPPHYYVMKPFCMMVQHEDDYYLNPLLLRLNYGNNAGDEPVDVRDRLNEPFDTIGECLYYGACGDWDEFLDMIDRDDEMFFNLQIYGDLLVSDIAIYV